jgi:hypothetical protein
MPAARKEGPDGFLQNAPFFLSQEVIGRIGISRIGQILKGPLRLLLRGGPARLEFSAHEGLPVPVRDRLRGSDEKDFPFLPRPEGITPDELEHRFLNQVRASSRFRVANFAI